jgi:hypothetical protein
MSEVEHVRTVCRSCHGGCGVIAHVNNAKVVKVEGDPASPISHGSMCAKGLAVTNLRVLLCNILRADDKQKLRDAKDLSDD